MKEKYKNGKHITGMINENLKYNIPQANGCKLATFIGKEF